MNVELTIADCVQMEIWSKAGVRFENVQDALKALAQRTALGIEPSSTQEKGEK